MGRPLYALFALFAVPVFAAAGAWSTSGPPGGAAWNVVAHPDDPQVAYLATEGSLYRTTDAGANWSALGSFTAPHPTSVAFDPTDSSTMYVATLEHNIWVSYDSGATWEESVVDDWASTPPEIVSLEVHPAAPSTLYAGTNGRGVYKSTDGGGTWTQLTSPSASAIIWSIAGDPADPNIVYLANQPFASSSNDGVLKSTNGGSTWTRVVSGLTPDVSGRVEVWDIDINGTTIYIATAKSGIGKSTNGGASWTKIYPATSGVYPSFYSVEVDPGNGSILLAGASNGLVRSVNGGTSWTTFVPSPAEGRFYGALAALGTATTTVLAGNNSTLYRSSDAGVSYAVSQAGIHARNIKSLLYDSATTSLFAAGRDGIHKSTTNGASWTAATAQTFQGYEVRDIVRGGSALAVVAAGGSPRRPRRGLRESRSR